MCIRTRRVQQELETGPSPCACLQVQLAGKRRVCLYWMARDTIIFLRAITITSSCCNLDAIGAILPLPLEIIHRRNLQVFFSDQAGL